jgi:glyoxylase-like metal-dependent hydrolase (beta-lactamase superfamily II)/8-oxo-dGTP pyrophosphatase MutT (NUDIX family)
MAFAPDVHVFPGGRVDPADAQPSLIARSVLSADDAAAALGGDLAPTEAIAAFIAVIREAFEEAGVLLADAPGSSRGAVNAARAALVGGEIGFQALAAQLDLTLRTDQLVSIARWVTPPILPRRFDTRFFVAAMPGGATATIEGDEVVDQTWLRPADALEAMAEGRMGFWIPTSATLQHLSHVDGVETVRDRLATGLLGAVDVEVIDDDVTRITMPAGGGVAGQPVHAYLIGRRSFVLVDPGDPTGPGLDRAVELAAERGGSIAAIALTHVDPDHHASAEGLAEQFGIEIIAGPGAGRSVPFGVREIADGDVIGLGDVPLRVVATPGPRPDHVAYLVGQGTMALTGDLDGIRGARSILGPSDDRAWTTSRAGLAALAPNARWLGGHPPRD